MIEDIDGEKFGYYFSTEIFDCAKWMETDNETFEFNLASNGRLPKPMKYEIHERAFGMGYILHDEYDERLVTLGDINLYKSNKQYESYCEENSIQFNHHGIEHPIHKGISDGYWGTEMKLFLKRILVIQMSEKEE